MLLLFLILSVPFPYSIFFEGGRLLPPPLYLNFQIGDMISLSRPFLVFSLRFSSPATDSNTESDGGRVSGWLKSDLLSLNLSLYIIVWAFSFLPIFSLSDSGELLAFLLPLGFFSWNPSALY